MTEAPPSISATIATGVVSFASGLVTGYLLEKYRERTRTKTALSENIYRPLHVELTLFLGRIADHVRPGGSITWQTIKAGGLAKLINKKLRERLDLFYSMTLPEYETAWQACENRINAVREQWDHAYGTPPGGTQQRDINWFNFLVASECILPLRTINE
jgi:hypothetical protein